MLQVLQVFLFIKLLFFVTYLQVHCVDFTMSLSQESFQNGKIFRPLNQNWKFFFFVAEYFLAKTLQFPSIVAWYNLRQNSYLSFCKSFNHGLYGHPMKKSENLGRCGRQNMLQPYLKIWDQDCIFSRAVKAISSLGVRSP